MSTDKGVSGEREPNEAREVAERVRDKLAVHYSSATAEWSTPQDFFNKVGERFNFALDVCANANNNKTEKYYSQYEDGLVQDWVMDSAIEGGDVWMNPPYGRTIQKWVKKAYESSLEGATVVCLLPARTSTRWFHDYCLKGEVEFVRGRLKFGGAKHNAPFPCMLVVFEGKK